MPKWCRKVSTMADGVFFFHTLGLLWSGDDRVLLSLPLLFVHSLFPLLISWQFLATHPFLSLCSTQIFNSISSSLYLSFAHIESWREIESPPSLCPPIHVQTVGIFRDNDILRKYHRLCVGSVWALCSSSSPLSRECFISSHYCICEVSCIKTWLLCFFGVCLMQGVQYVCPLLQGQRM